MLIFTEFINIKGSSNEIIRDIIMPSITNCMEHTKQSKHLNRVTLGAILAICKRDITIIDYFKQTIGEYPYYITHLCYIIKCEIESSDKCSALYASEIFKIIN
jgi:hypothetical protein